MTSRCGVATAGLLALVMWSGCGRERARTQAGTTALSARAAGESNGPAFERPMASRREAQPFLDSAGVLLVNGDTNAAVVLLHRGAALVVTTASESRGPASEALLATGERIDRLAGALARREKVGALPLSHISALLNLAEADRHLALATVACSTRSRESIYDELTMAVDHVERAAQDGGITLAAHTRRAIADVRQAAAPLATNCAQNLDPLDDAIANLQLEIAEMRRRVKAQ